MILNLYFLMLISVYVELCHR